MVDVTLANGSDHDVYVVIDAQHTPLWLEIDQPSLPLNGYGQQWCSGTAGLHNDPAFRMETVPAGGSLSYGWHGTYAKLAYNCWFFERSAAGPHAARACVYDAKPEALRTAPYPSGSSKNRPPSEWFTDKPSRCIDFTFELPAPGVTTKASVAL